MPHQPLVLHVRGSVLHHFIMLAHVTRRCCVASSTAPRGLMPAAVATAVRALNVHEYQGAELLAKFGVNVPPGRPAKTPAEALAAAAEMADAAGEVVVKSQVRHLRTPCEAEPHSLAQFS